MLRRKAAEVSSVQFARLDARTLVLLEAPVAATLVKLAAPNILVNIAQSSIGLIETYFVGKLVARAASTCMKLLRARS